MVGSWEREERMADFFFVKAGEIGVLGLGGA